MRLRKRLQMPTEYSDMNNDDDSDVPHIDTKLFIWEVQKRPAIWDTSSRHYSNKQLKKDSWDQLVDIFIPKKDNPSEAEKIAFCKKLQRKWKSARDCFNRECQRLEKAKKGEVTTRKSPYMYFKNLSFLHKVMAKNKSTYGTKKTVPSSNDASNSTDTSIVSNTDTTPNITDNSSFSNTDTSANYAADTSSMSVNDVYLIEDDEDIVPYTEPRSSKRRKVEMDLDDDSQLTRMLQPNIQLIEGKEHTTENAAKAQEEDSDKLFLLSLHEPLKQIPKRLKMSVRVKMMQIIDGAIKLGSDMLQE